MSEKQGAIFLRETVSFDVHIERGMQSQKAGWIIRRASCMVAVIAVCGASAGRGALYWVPEDVPPALRKLVPPRFHKTAFGIGWMYHLSDRLKEGKDPMPDPLHAFQCASFLSSAMRARRFFHLKNSPKVWMGSVQAVIDSGNTLRYRMQATWPSKCQ
jgi:hypothetical protein